MTDKERKGKDMKDLSANSQNLEWMKDVIFDMMALASRANMTRTILAFQEVLCALSAETISSPRENVVNIDFGAFGEK